jgi:hypothetical protein
LPNTHQTKKYNDCTYIFSDQHRNLQNRNKSEWKISQDEEFNSFILMCDENWIFNEYKGWSLHRINSSNEKLGKNRSREWVKIAKFVDSTKNSEWHGYPVDYRESIHDKPPTKILKEWVKKGIISKSQMGKIVDNRGCDI